MTTPVFKPSSATIGDLLVIPEQERFHEIIDGELIRKAMPSARHGSAQSRVVRAVGPYDRGPRPPGPGGWWIATEVEIQLAPDQVYRPDVVGWLRQRLAATPEEIPVLVRPDWVCEVLSASNKRNDTVKKRRTYHRHGLPHYWIVDPQEETLEIFRWHADGYLQVLVAERGDRVAPEPFNAVELQVGVLFGDDPDEE